MLVTTLCGMRAATFAVGLLPTYDRIGIRAPGASGVPGETPEGDTEVNG